MRQTSQRLLDLAEHHFNRIQIRTVRRQITQLRAGLLDQLGNWSLIEDDLNGDGDYADGGEDESILNGDVGERRSRTASGAPPVGWVPARDHRITPIEDCLNDDKEKNCGSG